VHSASRRDGGQLIWYPCFYGTFEWIVFGAFGHLPAVGVVVNCNLHLYLFALVPDDSRPLQICPSLGTKHLVDVTHGWHGQRLLVGILVSVPRMCAKWPKSLTLARKPTRTQGVEYILHDPVCDSECAGISNLLQIANWQFASARAHWH
jgi:hypothetical protein